MLLARAIAAILELVVVAPPAARAPATVTSGPICCVPRFFYTGPYFVFGNLAGMRGLVMLVPAVDEVPAPRCLPPTGTRGAIMRL